MLKEVVYVCLISCSHILQSKGNLLLQHLQPALCLLGSLPLLADVLIFSPYLTFALPPFLLYVVFLGLLHATLIFCYMPSTRFPSGCKARFSELCEIYLITKNPCSPAVNVICIPEDLQTSFTWHSQQWGKRIKWVCGHITRPPAESYENARPILIRKNVKSLHENHHLGLLWTTSCNYVNYNYEFS